MKVMPSLRSLLVIACMALLAPCLAGGSPALAAGPFEPGWELDKAASSLTFQSVKNGSKVETSTFESYEGEISPDGIGTIRIKLESVNTGVDLRNVRMRFLFFETFKFPEAVVTVRLDPAALADLPARRRIQLPLTYELELHGIRTTLTAPTVVTLFADDQVSVASAAPISIGLDTFGLLEGMRKLEDAAKVTIVPSGSVSFDFVFRRLSEPAARPLAAAAGQPQASAAVETSGNFSEEECVGRFEILSRTGAIYFRSGSAELDQASLPLLKTVLDIVNRCPGLAIAVEGHTDSAGGDAFNQRLSEARAARVADYLVDNGVGPARVRSVGYGESRPVAPNDTDRNKARNRRIEFTKAN